MKVLIVTNMYPTQEHPGLGTFVKTQAESLANEGVQIEVQFVNGVASRWNYLKGIFELQRHLGERSYDLIHAHYGFTGVLARLQGRCPLVVSFSGDDVFGTPGEGGHYRALSRGIARANRLLAQCVDAVIVKSQAMKNELAWPDASVIPNGVDFERFKPLSKLKCRKQLGLDALKKIVLFAGNPAVSVKRFDVAEKAFGKVQETLPDAELLPVWKASHEMIPVYMNAADVLVLTSQHEGSPNVIKEAMACNLPVVSVDVGDVREVVGDTEHCYVVNRTPEDVGEKLIEVLSQGERSNGRSRISHLSLTAIARRVIAVYQGVLDGNVS